MFGGLKEEWSCWIVQNRMWDSRGRSWNSWFVRSGISNRVAGGGKLWIQRNFSELFAFGFQFETIFIHCLYEELSFGWTYFGSHLKT